MGISVPVITKRDIWAYNAEKVLGLRADFGEQNHTLRNFRSIYNHARRAYPLPETPTNAIEWFEERPESWRLRSGASPARSFADLLDRRLLRRFRDGCRDTGLCGDPRDGRGPGTASRAAAVMTSRRALHADKWPAADRAMWDALIRDGDILDGRGPFTHLRPATVGLRAKAYGFWLGFLVDQGVDLAAESPAERATLDRLRAFVASLEGLSPGSQAQRVVSLYLILRDAAPERDWRGLATAASRLQRIEVRRSRGRSPAADVSAATLAGLGAALADEADSRADLDPVARAILARDGAAISVLAHLPLRIANLAALEVGRTLIDRGEIFSVRVEPGAAKAGRAIEARLPCVASSALRRYLEGHRAHLVDPLRSGQAVFLTHSGSPYPAYKLSERIATVAMQRIGVRVSAHRFRLCAATTIAEVAPEQAAIIRALLAHSTAKVADRAYNQAKMRHAASDYHDSLVELQKRARAKS